MKKIVPIVLVMVLLASAVPLAVTPAAAYEYEWKIPCDDGDNELTKDELVNAILPYMLSEGDLKLDDVGDAAYVYAYWDGKPKTVIDTFDRTVTVKRPVERLIVYSIQLEMIRSLKVDEEDRIVGVGDRIQKEKNNILYYPEYQDKPTFTYGDPESVLKLCPDLVIVLPLDGPWWTPQEFLLACEAASIPMFRAWCGVRGLMIVEEAEKLGYLFDKEDEADEFIDWYEGNIGNPVLEKVKEVPEEDKQKVYSEYSRYKANFEPNSHIAKTGGKDIFEGKGGNVDPEAVAMLNPDIIVLRRAIGGFGTTDTTEFEEAREELMTRKELKNVTAVKTGKVYVFSGYITSYMGTSGCKQFILDAYQAKWFHPDLFPDLDPQVIHQEYLTRFQGLDYDLDKQGVFVYHPEEHPDGN